MGWGGIQNIPPGFDVFGGKDGERNIVEDAIRGRVKGLSPAREPMFVDLKRNLAHQDYARYFDGCLPCAAVLEEIEGGRYLPEILRDIIERALAVAREQMDSIRADAVRSRETGRKMQYDAQASLDHLHRKSRPLAVAYPAAVGAKELDETYTEVSRAVRELLTE